MKPEKTPQKQVNIYIDPDLFAKLEKEAQAQGRARSNMVCQILKEYFTKKGERK